jgi:hypothetical protein
MREKKVPKIKNLQVPRLPAHLAYPIVENPLPPLPTSTSGEVGAVGPLGSL